MIFRTGRFTDVSISYMSFNVLTFFRSRKSNVVSSTNLYPRMFFSKPRSLITFRVFQRKSSSTSMLEVTPDYIAHFFDMYVKNHDGKHMTGDRIKILLLNLPKAESCDPRHYPFNIVGHRFRDKTPQVALQYRI